LDFNELYGDIFQKRELLTTTFVITSNSNNLFVFWGGDINVITIHPALYLEM
jgi:hypothetical protein